MPYAGHTLAGISFPLEIPSVPTYLPPVAVPGIPMASPFQFIQQVRAEVDKVVWPTRREVITTTVMVFIMAAITSIFFFLIDIIIRQGLQGILGMFG
jgi:preprotein translocase subunit SecE